MTRLVSGAKVKVDSVAMKRLTSKNYEKLPEVQRKKQEAKRREEELEKKKRIAAM